MSLLNSKETKAKKENIVEPDTETAKTVELNGITKTPNQEIGVKKLDKDAQLPQRAHETDACFDIRANEDVIVQHNKVVKVKTGLAFDLPKNIAAFIYGRSGLALKGVMLANAVGVIDSGYRDEVCVPLTNTTKEPFEVKKGDRIAQVRFEQNLPCQINEVEELSTSDRNGGFGHTGVK